MLSRPAAGRSVTLVICDGEGEVLGELEPFDVDVPWWPEVGEVTAHLDRVTGASGTGAVLRLIDGDPAPGAEAGGSVSYLVEVTGTRTQLERVLLPTSFVPIDDPLRAPWARPGGPASDLAWVAGYAEITGRPEQHRTWNLSAIWAIPTVQGRLWLKCVPPMFVHEAAVLRELSGRRVPELVASSEHRLLLEEMPGEDGYEASAPERLRLVSELVDLQLPTAGRGDDLLANGVPDARSRALATAIEEVVQRRAPDDRHLRRLLDGIDQRLAAIDACGLPDLLVHGDAHPGNARIKVEPGTWFDWGDSRIGNPLLDLAVLERLSDRGLSHSEVSTMRDHWFAAWRAAVPGSDPAAAWKLLEPLAHLRLAAVYQTFLDNIEDSERRYHEGDVMPILDAVSARLAR